LDLKNFGTQKSGNAPASLRANARDARRNGCSQSSQ